MIKPKRQIQLTIDLGADSWDIAADTLQSIVDRIKIEGPIKESISSGYDSGYVVIGSESPNQTGEKYRLENREYCNYLKQTLRKPPNEVS